MSKNDRLITKPSTIECVMHKDIDEDSAITGIETMKVAKLRTVLFWVLVLLTSGLFYIVCFWFPSLHIRLCYIKCDVSESTHVQAKSKYYGSFTKIIRLNSITQGELIMFKYQELPYYYENGKFKPLYFKTNLPNKVLIDTYGQGYYDESIPKEYKTLYGECLILVPVIPLPLMIFKELLNPFYLFQVYAVILWCFEEYYYYAIAIVIITSISFTSTIVTTRKGIIALHNLAKKVFNVNVVRKGNTFSVPSLELVPGDLVEIKQKMELPCDLCLISGGCIVEEGMLTGESVPVLKDALPYLEDCEYDPDQDKRHTLYEGTKVIQTRNYTGSSVLAVVVRTGFGTVKGRLIRSIMYPKPNKFKFYEDSMKFILFLACFNIVGFGINIPRMIYLEFDSTTIAIRLLDLITITVPAALPACMAAGVATAISRLKKQKIYCIVPNRVNVAGKIDVLVFDKTGTLTEDGMNLLGVQALKDFYMQPIKPDPKEDSPRLLECMASCHSLALVNKELLGDSQDLQIFKSTGWVYEEPEDDLYDPIVQAVVRPQRNLETPQIFDSQGQILQMIDLGYELGVLHIFHFTSKLKRMGVVVKNLSTQEVTFYCKGAPETILEKCSDVPQDLNAVLSNYTRAGYRVLACAYKTLTNLKYTQLKSTKIEDLEVDLSFIGLIILQNKLKDKTIKSIEILHNANIKTIMATGDAVLTGISVARECNLISPIKPVYLGELQNDEIMWEVFETKEVTKTTYLEKPPWMELGFEEDYILALTGTAFNKMVKDCDDLNEASRKNLHLCLEKCQVYARMAPEHKTLLVEKLQELKYLVGMCGDGANDCGALKTADVGVSLSEADSSIAAPFTSQIADISSVLIVLKEGRCALTTSIQCFKYMALYSIIQFVNVSFLYWFLEVPTNNQYLIADLITVMPLAIFMSLTGPCGELSRHQPTAELMSLRILSSVSIQAILQASFQISIYAIYVWKFGSYRDVQPNEDVELETEENTISFFAAWLEYQIICIVFSIGKPWKKPSYTNFFLTFYQVFIAFVSIFCLFFDSWIIRDNIDVIFM